MQAALLGLVEEAASTKLGVDVHGHLRFVALLAYTGQVHPVELPIDPAVVEGGGAQALGDGLVGEFFDRYDGRFGPGKVQQERRPVELRELRGVLSLPVVGVDPVERPPVAGLRPAKQRAGCGGRQPKPGWRRRCTGADALAVDDSLAGPAIVDVGRAHACWCTRSRRSVGIPTASL